ncbi:MAG: glycine zipper 2TM domain-containing protein [Pseudomonadota bacterium]
MQIKKLRNSGIIVLVLASFVVSACSTKNENIGRVSGAVAGGLLGNQFGGGSGRVAATIIGALAGGVIGGNIGRELDNNSRQMALRAEYDALERGKSGQPVEWTGSNGVRGQVIPHQTYQVGSQNCRRYSQTVYIDGTTRRATGTACRNTDGSWTPLT